MDQYICSKCLKTNCKLWRLSCSSSVELKCANCLGFGSKIDSSGKVVSDMTNSKTDQLGSFVPAVPKSATDFSGYWGYTSVPDNMIDWWTSLPSKN